MSWVAVAVVGATAVSSAYSADRQRRAAHQASDAQSAAAQQGIEANDARFEQMMQILAPYVGAGNQALGMMGNIAGTNGAEAQQQAVQGIQNGPMFQALQAQGNDAILQNAAATGGLRGGNTQGALAQFSPNLLNSLIQQQYSQLGGIASMGANAAAMQGGNAMQNGQQTAQLLQQQGAAQAGGLMASGQYAANMANTFGQAAGMFGSMYGAQQQQPNAYTTPNAVGSYQNPASNMYDYRGTTLPNSMRGGF